MGTITIERKVFLDIIEELQLMKESLEFMSDPEIMEGHQESKEQIKNRDFGEWDDL